MKTPAQATSEFTLLRDIQRTLRLHEISDPTDEAKQLRDQVIARMAQLAPLVSAAPR